MKSKFFFVIYLSDKKFESLLNAMRLVADPKQRNISHITVKGPYKTAQRKRLRQDNKLIQGEEIKVLGAGNFFQDNQNTVFLKCEDKEELVTIWKSKEEKTYPNYHPHITIYDGNDSFFANELFQTIKNHNIHFRFKVDELGLYSSLEKQSLFNLKSKADYDLLSDLADKPITESNIEKLTEKERISLIDKLCDQLARIAKASDYSMQPAASRKPTQLIEA